jgi:lipopolysaccharide export system permease protein
MKTLDRYLGASVVSGFLIVMVVMLPVFSFLVFVDELEDVGKGDYDALDALVFVLLTAPERILDLAPVTALLGGIVSLGGLASRNELVAMRAAGISILRLSWSIAKAVAAIMLIIAVLTQFVAPPIHQYAEKRRSLAISGSVTLLKDEGFWSRDGRRYINVRTVLHGRIPANIDIYEFDQDGQLRIFLSAGQAEIDNPRLWRLKDVRRKIIDKGRILTQYLPSATWEAFLTPTQIRVLELPVESLSPLDLFRYIQYLKKTGQQANHFELTLWQDLMLPLSTGAMALLSFPFLFGSLRSTNFGTRLVMGTLVGVVFSVLQQIIANLGLLMDLSPPLVALSPTVLITLLVLPVLRWIR